MPPRPNNRTDCQGPNSGRVSARRKEVLIAVERTGTSLLTVPHRPRSVPAARRRVPVLARVPARRRRGLRCAAAGPFLLRSCGQPSIWTDALAAGQRKAQAPFHSSLGHLQYIPRFLPPCSPENKCSSTARVLDASYSANSSRAAERSRDTALSLESHTSSASRGTRVQPTPRFSVLALRAESTSTRRVSSRQK